MRARLVISILLAVLVAASGCGKDEKKAQKGEGDEGAGRYEEECEKIKKRNLQCLEVLVPLAQKRARQMLEKALAKVPEQRRALLRKKMEEAFSKQREELKETMRESLKKPFMNWCRRAAGDPEQKKVLEKATGCLDRTDCQSYGECVDELMMRVQKDFHDATGAVSPPRKTVRDAKPEGRDGAVEDVGDGGSGRSSTATPTASDGGAPEEPRSSSEEPQKEPAGKGPQRPASR
jgi:hypothetical protein